MSPRFFFKKPCHPARISSYTGREGGTSMEFIRSYDRRAAVLYAHEWAFGRNPAFYDYEDIGGDCTNFASQCIFAGSGVMNFTPTFGWYYIDSNQKAPAWTGVPYLYNFLTRKTPSVGPVAEEVPIWEIMPGDIVQLSFKGVAFQHSPVVVRANKPQSPEEILVAAHSYDADNRPLSTYEYQKVRYLHITGVIRP